jgi:hypothetical protein
MSIFPRNFRQAKNAAKLPVIMDFSHFSPKFLANFLTEIPPEFCQYFLRNSCFAVEFPVKFFSGGISAKKLELLTGIPANYGKNYYKSPRV